MDTVLYLVLSFIDAFVVLVLMFKLFRFPVKEYLVEFSKISVVIMLVSYLVRIVLKVPIIDPFVQTIVFIIMLRVLIEIRIVPAILITIQGYIGTITLQVLLAFVVGLFIPGDVSGTSGIKVYTIQLLGQLLNVFMAYLLYKLNCGFSFIIRPPHDLSIKRPLDKKQLWILIASIIGNLIVCGSFYYWLHIENSLFIVLPVVLIASSIIYFLTHRKDSDL